MNYAALMDANDDVVQVIVIPPGETAAYCTQIGLPGTWRQTTNLPAIGYRFAEGGFFMKWAQIPGAGTGPDGATDGFPLGFELFHNGRVWRSTVNFNIFEPGVANWHRRDGTWVQPTGATDTYPLNAVVTFNGQTWRSTTPNNIWQPGVFGWQLEA